MMTASKPVKPHIRWMIRNDLPQVLRIEAVTEWPWTEPMIFETLRQRNCIGMVAESNERVLGWMVYEFLATRMELIRLSVHPERRRLGVGTALVNRLKEKLAYPKSEALKRRKRLHHQIEESNLGGCLFLKALGFQAIEVVRQPFAHIEEDGILMEFRP